MITASLCPFLIAKKNGDGSVTSKTVVYLLEHIEKVKKSESESKYVNFSSKSSILN